MAKKQQRVMGEVLVELGLVDEYRLRHALEFSRREKVKLGEALMRLGYLGEDHVLGILKNLTGVVTLNMRAWSVKKHAQTLIPRDRMVELKAIPLDANNKRAVVAFADPFDYVAVEHVRFLLNRDVTPVLATVSQIEDIIAHLDVAGYGVKTLQLSDVRRAFANVTIQDLNLASILKLFDDPGCTSVHLAVGTSPAVRIGGSFRRCRLPILTPQALERIVEELTDSDRREFLRTHKEIEFSLAAGALARFRVSIYRQKGTELGVIIKRLMDEIPSVSTLGLPSVLSGMLDRKGLVLISSARGQGKDTTIAALVDHINSTRSVNIITLEDPIEYIHHHKFSNVNQRELGSDTDEDLPSVFERAIRLDPDVLVITDLKHPFMMDTATMAAHKGILVLAGINAVDVFSALEQFASSLSSPYMRGLFSRSLLGAFSQRLVWS
ncbi:MAG TPA: ATPase, T2SS/T4P/T4SS family, partial [Deltaproteobacteria bacterium]|nr:ATPase, T2SS/T4P/T4SS family [Deltaproteobacteria bacterium]